MFIGHFAVGFGAKKAAPRVSLGTLFLSVQFVDLIWPILVLLGIEHVRNDPGNTAFTPLDFYDYPISHSLLMALVWAAAFGIVYYLVRRQRNGAFIVVLGVLSHWVLDLISHRPDLPLVPGGNTYVGLGLWNSVPATVIVEGLLFVAGVVLYTWSTRAIDRTGQWSYWGLVAFLAVVWIANMGTVPPSVTVIGVSGLSLWLIVAWGYWVDRHRAPAEEANQKIFAP